MNIRIQVLLPAVVATALIPFVSGCYTQLETVDSAYDEPVAQEDTAITETIEDFDRDYPPPGYYTTFSYYHPGFSVGYGVYDSWDWYYYPAPLWCGPWYPPYYYPAYGWWPYYSSWYYPSYPVVYYGDNGNGGYYSGGGERPSETRNFGNSRGYGDGVGTRGRGGVAPRTGGEKDGDPITAIPASISRPTRQGGATVASGSGKKTETPQRRVAANRTPTRRSAEPQASPTERVNTGTRGGSDRGSVSSTPKSSPSPPASSGNRGSSSGSGSSRGRGPRSR